MKLDIARDLERRHSMKKKIFALLLALCAALTMMPAMALAAETTESDASSAPTMAAYKDSEGTEEIAGGVIDGFDEFYLVSTYVPAEGETVKIFGNYGSLPGIVVGDTAFNSKGYPYAKITITGKFDAFHYWTSLWCKKTVNGKEVEDELCGANLTITKSEAGSLDSEATKDQIKELVEKLGINVKATKTSKGIKVKLDIDDGSNATASITGVGYKVKYQFLRSTSKTKNYKVVATRTSKTYVNTSAKKGTKYYYKCRVAVYDANGKLVAKTKLSQSDVAAKKR